MESIVIYPFLLGEKIRCRSKMTEFTVQVITTSTELSALEASWNELLAKEREPSIFLTWEWMKSWLESVGQTVELFIIAVHDQPGNLVAVAPFYCSTMTLVSGPTYKVLRIMGDCHSGAEYQDVIIRDGLGNTPLGKISEILEEERTHWDLAWFPNVASWTGALDRLQQCFTVGNYFFRQRERSFSAVSLPNTWEDYLQNFSRQRRSTLRRQQRKIEREHNIAFTICRIENDIEDFLKQLFLLHKKRWRPAGHDGAFVRSPVMMEFYRKIAPRVLQQGWLGLFALQVDGQVVAIQYGYVFHGVFSQLQEGFDPDGPAGSGNVLRMHVLRWCIENDIRVYDFLGGVSPHKAKWQAVEKTGCELFVGSKKFKNIPFYLLPLWPTGRYVRREDPDNQ